MRRVRPSQWLLLLAAALCGCGAGFFLRVTRVDLSPGLRAVLGGGGNAVIVRGGGDALLVDVKFGDFARRLRREVEEELGREVRRVLLSHSHADHAGGLGLYPEVRAVLAHPNAIRRLQGDPPGVPWIEVERELELRLGKRRVRVLYLGVGHTDGDLVAYFPDERLLVTGDLFVQGFEPFIDAAAGGNILELRKTLERALALPFQRVVPGHGEISPRADVERMKEYLVQLEKDVAKLVGEGRGEKDVVAALSKVKTGFQGLPFGANRELSVRRMYEAVTAARAAAPGESPR